MTTPTHYPLAWPDGWPRTRSASTSRFKTTLEGALKNVKSSLRMFGVETGRAVGGVVISTNYSLDVRRPADGGVAVYFQWGKVPACIAVDRYAKLEDNLQAVHHVLEAERTKLRHGGLHVVEASFRGFTALPPPKRAQPWHEVLGVLPQASLAEIDAAYRHKAKAAHPDAGGSVEAWLSLQSAHAAAREERAS